MPSIFERVTHGLLLDDTRRGPREVLLRLADGLTFLMGIAAVVAITAKVGFRLGPRGESMAATATWSILYLFLGLTALKILVARSRPAYLRAHIPEILASLLCVFILIFPRTIQRALAVVGATVAAEGIASLYLVVTQGALLLAFLPGALRASRRLMSLPVQPALLIVLSFLALVAIGTGALLLPRATTGRPLTVIEALFTATSAACVTGLIVVDTSTVFAPLGRWVILVLMQIGGLGIMTLTTFFASMVGRRGSLKEYATLQAILGRDSIGRIRGAASQIVLSTLAIEAAGAVAIYLSLRLEPTQGVFFALFHSVSAFCNAGFSLLSDGLADPLFAENPAALITITALIVTGGLGFAVIRNIVRTIGPRRARARRESLTLHTRIVLITTLALVAAGAIAFGLIERGGTLAESTTGELVLHSVFQSVTARTAGFNTVDMTAIAAPTALVVILLMWIGASPGSTGGGIKTTSFALVLLHAWAVARGSDTVKIGRLPVHPSSVAKAQATIIVSLVLAAIGFLALAVTQRVAMLPLAFETFSAAGTVGLSMGSTRLLDDTGRVVVIILMFTGRVGFLTMAMALTTRRRENRVAYGDEQIPVL